ncbi:hypothetical protein OH76DRAFT_1344634 [Lentinus brumalis]|uniref:MYND-type domain-containing protein n=1 Tax=Lentinus brumalis TaxID=2498619 RepID=A0A371DJW8_9APHY|nr:hypothetical protein OH76DRAFT_1344634 [Polyporus brumalis]
MSIEDCWKGLSVANANPALRRCRECGRGQDEGHRLQRCTGCFLVLYCSKSCQKTGWKTHKLSCGTDATATERLSDPEWNVQMRTLGFSNFSSFSDVVQQWRDANGWAIHLCASVLVMQGGGIHASQNPQKIVSLSLTRRRSVTPDLPSSRNPSTMLVVEDLRLLDLEESLTKGPDLRAQWECGAPARAAKREKYATHPLFAGILPVVFTFDELPAAAATIYIAQCHPNPGTRPFAEQLAPIRDTILEDLMHLGVDSINAGFSLRAVLGASEGVLPGHFVRSHGTWTWQQLFSDWSQYRRGQHTGLDQTIDKLRSGFTPSTLLEMFQCLVLS